METSALFTAVLPFIRTTYEASKLSEPLYGFFLSFFSTKTGGSDPLSELPRELADLLHKALPKEGLNHQQVNQKVQDLADKLKECKILTLTLAFEPSDSTLNVLSIWVRREIDSTTLLDI